MTRWMAFLRQRCPRCRQAPLFQGIVEVYPTCRSCGLPIERESGYFLGAMYVGYFLSLPIFGLLFWLLRAITSWSVETVIATAAVFYLPTVPFIVRVARLAWIYLDQGFDPGRHPPTQ